VGSWQSKEDGFEEEDHTEERCRDRGRRGGEVSSYRGSSGRAGAELAVRRGEPLQSVEPGVVVNDHAKRSWITEELGRSAMEGVVPVWALW
jgi:hypothetical protein